jgi:dihydrofolate reductase
MSKVTCQLSISLDGYAAGPNQSRENPLGEGGERLHEWAIATDTWNEAHGHKAGTRPAYSEVAASMLEGVGAFIMGRNMFSAGRGAWDESWTGWWGEDPPFHAPTYVLTHHEREPVEMQGGTTFHFVTDGIESALEQARAVAGDLAVAIAGGANTVNQYPAAGLLDEVYLHLVPIVLGGGERLLVGVGDPKLEPVEVIPSPAATHIRYRVSR